MKITNTVLGKFIDGLSFRRKPESMDPGRAKHEISGMTKVDTPVSTLNRNPLTVPTKVGTKGEILYELSECGTKSGLIDFLIPYSLFLTSYFLLLASLFSGCVRLAGTAGYSYQGPRDEEPRARQVTLDTQDLVRRNQTPGSISV